jgi:hypothetical protein
LIEGVEGLCIIRSQVANAADTRQLTYRIMKSYAPLSSKTPIDWNHARTALSNSGVARDAGTVNEGLAPATSITPSQGIGSAFHGRLEIPPLQGELSEIDALPQMLGSLWRELPPVDEVSYATQPKVMEKNTPSLEEQIKALIESHTRTPAITADLLRCAQRWIGKEVGKMTISQFAAGAEITANNLSRYIHADGTLAPAGQLVMQAETGEAGGRWARIHADIVRAAHAEINATKSRDAFALEHNVSVIQLQRYVRANGSYTPLGEQAAKGGVRGGHVNPVNADTIRCAQAAIASGQKLAKFAEVNNISLSSIRKYMREDGTLKAIGEKKNIIFPRFADRGCGRVSE